MGEILNKEEVETLLSAVSSGKIPVEGTKEIPKKTIVPYDFRQTNRIPKDQIRFLETIHQNFIHIYATPLANYLRTMVEFNLVKVEQLRFVEFIASLPHPTYINILDLNPLKSKGILEINPSLTFSIVDRLLGGMGKDIGETRELTDIEYSIMEKVVLLTLDCLAQAWKPVFPLTLKIQSRETNPQFAQITAGEETVVSITMEGKVGKSSGLMNLCIPYLAIKPIISKLTSQHRAFSGYEALDEKEDKSMEKAMRQIKVDLIAELGTSEISIGDFLQLEVGDVVRLKQNIHRNIIIKVGNSPKFYALPGCSGRQMAVQITSVIKPVMENAKGKR